MSVVRSVAISVDLAAIRHNFAQARSFSDSQKLFAVIKADAYGHGSVEVARALEEADGFAVVTLAEAMRLRAASISQPILVLQGPQQASELDAFAEHTLWAVIHEHQQLLWLKASEQASSLPVWLKLDTGMGRLGFGLEQALILLQENASLNWQGALSHLACADELGNAHTESQITRFQSWMKRVSDAGIELQSSLANSAGLIGWPDTIMDWARPGLMLYGCSPFSNAASVGIDLKAAMRVTAPIIARKRVASGASIGYACRHVCSQDTEVALLAVGYADGLPRVLSPEACVFLHGERCAILGRVSMDSIAIDVSRVAQAAVGDQVLLWGPEHPVEYLADAAGTINYELLTCISGHRSYTQ